MTDAGSRPDGWRPESLLVSLGRSESPGDPLNVPPVLAANFRAARPGPAPEPESGAERSYARDDSTPTWEALEEAVGAIEGGHALAFASGMAAASAILDLVPAGSVIVAPDGCYAGVLANLADGARAGRWQAHAVDITDTEKVIGLLPSAALLWVETPTNPLLDIADLPALIAAARRTGTLVAVDNTFATALLQRPLDLGADLVMQSATKFIGGHSDLLLGLAITKSADLAARLRRRREVGGATPGALESYLALRGMRTMGVRLAYAQASAGELARRLSRLDGVRRVRYPGLSDDPGHGRAKAQMSGFGAVLSFELADARVADEVCATVRLITSATSLGGVESTIERRAKLAGQEHVPAGLLRFSVGCEHVEDLWHDLSTAIRRASGVSPA
ncbi:MAG: trans-sulfuration enzyme family protein [Nocardioides sp.]